MSGWQVRHFNTENLHNKLPQLLYVSPSNPYKGRSLSPQGRLDLLRWAQQNSAYILEDDYNGEFRYFSHPISSLQGMSGGQNVIYCGSFSRILLPSLRISYLVLPQNLLPVYNRIKHLYNQTSSSIEQFALAEFIASGGLRRHIKKMRRRYAVKTLCCALPLPIFSAARQALWLTNPACTYAWRYTPLPRQKNWHKRPCQKAFTFCQLKRPKAAARKFCFRLQALPKKILNRRSWN